MQPNGTRINTNVRERLCVSDPVLWDLVAQDRVAQLRANPQLTCVSIAPNDGGGGNKFCSCERCRALDPPEAQAMYARDPHLNPGPGGVGPFPPISDRYFRYFNEVAKRVKAEMPDRYAGAIAYSLYRSPPASIDKLSDNLIVGYVGPNTMTNDKQRESARKEFEEWSKKGVRLMIRPNLLGGGMGLPLIYARQLAADMRFFVDHGMRLTDYASCFGNWGTHGLNYYVLAKMLWDPYQEVDPIIDDYCRAAYGRGAGAVREYYRRAEELTNRVSASSPSTPEDHTTSDAFTDEAIAGLKEPLDQALAAIGDGDSAARERVQLLVTGLEYARQTRRLMSAAGELRAGRLTRQQFDETRDGVLAYYKTLVLDWAVAPEQNFRRMRIGMNARRGTVAADADEI
ncbi:MAG: hypothetical protein A3G75_12315 [Verrucomicrobia bacterium RIFCSPLOWO2_12_FULL_64_8]|nr:MAG: hypothetical protein A3G75_12315 [Verrucomicrobia bacterium RIFCSPLOWO2_12_FULL_64_8]